MHVIELVDNGSYAHIKRFKRFHHANSSAMTGKARVSTYPVICMFSHPMRSVGKPVRRYLKHASVSVFANAQPHASRISRRIVVHTIAQGGQDTSEPPSR